MKLNKIENIKESVFTWICHGTIKKILDPLKDHIYTVDVYWTGILVMLPISKRGYQCHVKNDNMSSVKPVNIGECTVVIQT